MIQYLSKADKKMLKGTALLRLDFNTEDEWRMEMVLPTIKFLLKRADKVVILSHRGRPPLPKLRQGKPAGFNKNFSMKKDASDLQKLLKKRVIFIPHFRFGEIKKVLDQAPPKSVFLLENLRFLRGEERNDSGLSAQLAGLGNFYINDAFAVSHRKNASVAAITKFLPSYAGFELEKEINFLSRVMKHPKKPLVIILGGAKIDDKLGVVEYCKNKADWFLLGGAAANAMLHLKGVDVKKSLIEKEEKETRIMKKFLYYESLMLPVDYKIEKDRILDIGPKTERIFRSKIKSAKMVIWSGPMGAIENKKFAHGTLAVAWAVAENKKVFSIAGGGETVMFLKKYKLDKKFSFISTGGGAMLDFLAGRKLPGIVALEK